MVLSPLRSLRNEVGLVPLACEDVIPFASKDAGMSTFRVSEKAFLIIYFVLTDGLYNCTMYLSKIEYV